MQLSALVVIYGESHITDNLMSLEFNSKVDDNLEILQSARNNVGKLVVMENNLA